METDLLDSLMQGQSLWVFAYGSLLWKPGFTYHRRVVGHVKGFKRRFFQGNTTFRGTETQPGRVAILVPDANEVTWGVAYEIHGTHHVQHALEHLYLRENHGGGYCGMLQSFYPRAEQPDENANVIINSELDQQSKSFLVLCFTATPSSRYYLGPADVSTMARQVVAAVGQAGPNSDYVLRTAEYVRHHIPEDKDPHLFELEQAVRDLIKKPHHSHSLTVVYDIKYVIAV